MFLDDVGCQTDIVGAVVTVNAVSTCSCEQRPNVADSFSIPKVIRSRGRPREANRFTSFNCKRPKTQKKQKPFGNSPAAGPQKKRRLRSKVVGKVAQQRFSPFFPADLAFSGDAEPGRATTPVNTSTTQNIEVTPEKVKV